MQRCWQQLKALTQNHEFSILELKGQHGLAPPRGIVLGGKSKGLLSDFSNLFTPSEPVSSL